MNNDFLQDSAFLLAVNRFNIKSYDVQIFVLDWQENLMKYITGKVTQGSLNINGESEIRRTMSMTFIADDDTINPMDLNSDLAINKKISVSLGIKNPFYGQTNELYTSYGDILYFKQGVFIITQVNFSINANAQWQIQVSLTDKMALLNGTVGGTFPASVTFHELLTTEDNGDITVSNPTIKRIIYEVVQHFGDQPAEKIIISDVPDTGRIVLNYIGESGPLYLSTNPGAGLSFNYQAPPQWFPVYQGQKVGYQLTDLTYPGELVANAGSNVTAVLQDIIKVLGNYQFYFDVEGNFRFEYKNQYHETEHTPLPSLNINTYLPAYNNTTYVNEFNSFDFINQISATPDLSKIKNDFICWGQIGSGKNDSAVNVRYHLAIDNKPVLKYGIDPTNGLIPEYDSLCTYYMWEIQLSDGNDDAGNQLYGKTVRYIFTKQNYTNGATITYNGILYPSTGAKGIEIYNPNVAINPTPPISGPEATIYFNTHGFAGNGWPADFFEWREELYRLACQFFNSSQVGDKVVGSPYDEELRAEWRKLYDPRSNSTTDVNSFHYKWNNHAAGVGAQNIWQALYDPSTFFGNWGNWRGYTPEVIETPERIMWWLDIIEATGEIGKYSIKNIGKRTIVMNNARVNQVYSALIPDLVWIENPGNIQDLTAKIQEQQLIGQLYTVYLPDQAYLFSPLSYYGSCFDYIKQMLYDNLVYHIKVNMTTIPLLNLKENQIARLDMPAIGLQGWYAIDSMSLDIGNMNSMQISMHQTGDTLMLKTIK